MTDDLNAVEKDLIQKYKLSKSSSNKDILLAAQKEYPESVAGSVAASVRHMLKGKK